MIINSKHGGGGITPMGKKLITDTNETDVAAFATAQVSSDTLLAENIKKDVNILGVVGNYEGGGGRVVRGSYTPAANTTVLTHNANFDAYFFVIYPTEEAAAAIIADTSSTQYYMMYAFGLKAPSYIPKTISSKEYKTTQGIGRYGRGSVGNYAYSGEFVDIQNNKITLYVRDVMMAGQTYNYVIWEITE